MFIRKAKLEDMEGIFKVFDIARQKMRNEGNDSQWINGYPQKELIENDITNEDFYVWVDETTDKIHGVFSFIIGDDPTYAVIENGAWLNDEPYGTIHRMGTDEEKRGLFRDALIFCLKKTDNIRVDTHEKNVTMQSVCEKNGFTYCGVIYVDDGSPRVAYQLVK